MGSINDIKRSFLELSAPDRMQLLHELLDSIHEKPKSADAIILTPKQIALGLTPDMVKKHPILQLAGRWTDEEAEEMKRIIKEGDWIDEDQG